MDHTIPSESESKQKAFIVLRLRRFWLLASCLGVYTIWTVLYQSVSVEKHFQPLMHYVFSYDYNTTEKALISGSSLSSIRVDILDIFDRFKPRTLESCNNTCVFHRSVCQANDWDTWSQVLRSGKTKAVPLFSDNEYVFPWEKDYLSYPPLKDIRHLPDVQKTSVYQIFNGVPSKENHVKAKLGQKVHFRLDLVDGYGKRRKYGGDEIRVWLKEHPNATTHKEYNAAGMVTDFKNGSYLVTVTPLWTGLTQLNIAFVFPREYIRAALHQARVGSHRFILGQFKKRNIEEATVCHSTPNIPGRPCVCNLTDTNEMSWFCGRPLDSRLSCDDWYAAWALVTPFLMDFTQEENIMAGNKSRPMEEALIPHNITIDVSPSNKRPSGPPCTKQDYTSTWAKDSPTGVWAKKSWTSVVCKAPLATPDMARKCLSNHTILIIGDSNSIRLWEAVTRLIPVKRKGKGSWPHRMFHYNKKWNITLEFLPHEYPLYTQQEWVPAILYGGVTSELDKISSQGKYVLIMHYYFHFSSSHLSGFHLRLKALTESLSRLIKRNPNVRIALRGVHISTIQWQTNHMFSGEVFGPFMTLMLKEMFKDLRKRIIYLDTWDMTIATQNKYVHPPDKFQDASFKQLVSLWCL